MLFSLAVYRLHMKIRISDQFCKPNMDHLSLYMLELSSANSFFTLFDRHIGVKI